MCAQNARRGCDPILAPRRTPPAHLLVAQLEASDQPLVLIERVWRRSIGDVGSLPPIEEDRSTADGCRERSRAESYDASRASPQMVIVTRMVVVETHWSPACRATECNGRV